MALSIVSNIVFGVGTFMNERFAFAASLGTCIILVYLLKEKIPQIKFKGIGSGLIILGIISSLYAFKTIDRVPVWESELELNKAAIKVSKNSARANSFMATAYFNRYKESTIRDEQKELLALAEPYARRAVELYPGYLNGNLMVAGIAAENYKMNRDLPKLLDEFKAIMLRRPDVDFLTTYLEYLNDRGNDLDLLSSFYLDAGNAILSQTNFTTWAAHYLLMGNKIDPQNQAIRAALVQAYSRMGRQDLANQYR